MIVTCDLPDFFGSSAILIGSVSYVWSKTIHLIPMWSRKDKRLDTPSLEHPITKNFTVNIPVTVDN